MSFNPKDFDFEQFRGTFTRDVPLGKMSWFKCGGIADRVFDPADIDDLVLFLEEYPEDAPLTILGGMANTIVRDGGIRGCVIRLGRGVSRIDVQGNRVFAEAGAFNATIASTAAKEGLGGLEFLSGIPGTIGGAIRMNAGAYGTEIKDCFVGAAALQRDGSFLPLEPSDMQFGYRRAALPEGAVLIAGIFEGIKDDPATVRDRLKEIKAKRQETQPIAEKTGGSTFANPYAEALAAAGLPEGTKAWQLVEKVGGRDLRIGGARMSDKHLNFMLNTGDATAADLEALGDELIARVQEACNLTLHWEIKRVGEV